jgi:hypothetical protein
VIADQSKVPQGGCRSEGLDPLFPAARDLLHDALRSLEARQVRVLLRCTERMVEGLT